MLRWLVLGAGMLLGGCTSFALNSSSKAVQGNTTGGIVPVTVTSESEANEAARAHCAQYNKVARVTATQGETGGKLIFVCELPGQSPPPGASTPADAPLPPGVKMKKQ